MSVTHLQLARCCEQSYSDSPESFDWFTHEYRLRVDRTDTQALCGMVDGDAVIAFRGSSSWDDWIRTNSHLLMVDCGLGMAHCGFVQAARSAMQDVLHFIRGMQPNEIYLTGHSLGGAVSVVMLQLLLGQGIDSDRINCITFGCPRVGEESFAHSLSKHRITQYARYGDPVVLLPPTALAYRHVAEPEYLPVDLDRDQIGHSMTAYRKDLECQ